MCACENSVCIIMNILEKITQIESRKLKFKEQLPEGHALLKIVTAFANGAGGELIIGLTDRERKIVGVEDPMLLEEQIMNSIHDGIYPPVSPFCSIITVEEKNILSVQILPGSNKPYYIKAKGVEKGSFIRIGSTNRLAGFEAIQELKRQVRGLSFVDEIDFQHQRKLFDEKSLNNFFDTIGLSEVNDDALVKLNILRRNNGDVLPTIAAMLLFGQSGSPDYDYAGVRLSRFSGTTMQNLLETREYGIPLIQLVDPLCHDIVSLLPKESFFKGARRIERSVIPFEAIREAIINAIVHRDYSIKGSSIKINLFDDRVEIISPGVLVGNLDIRDLGTGLSESRNRTMVRIFRYLGLMEELGTGIARIFDIYRERELKPPLFLEQGQFFKVILFQKKEYIDSATAIVNLLRLRGSLSAAQLAEQMGVHHNTVLKHLKKLILAGTVRKNIYGKKVLYTII